MRWQWLSEIVFTRRLNGEESFAAIRHNETLKEDVMSLRQHYTIVNVSIDGQEV